MLNLIHSVQSDVINILQNHETFLHELRVSPELLAKQGRVNSETVDNWLSILDNERQKAQRLEVVVAIVGTMKSGKSTTINAIVGAPVLPSRNTAMTTFPTLIRHVAGQFEPTLVLKKTTSLNELVAEVQERVRRLPQGVWSDIPAQLILQLRQGKVSFRQENTGLEAVYHTLFQLNDVLRLARALDISLEDVIIAHRNLNDLPTIQVAFTHLDSEQQTDWGNIALLDTPGPNEAGQGTGLRAVIQEQLARCSAVIQVMDYVQLSSEAEAEVRGLIGQVADRLGNRLHIIVNKFDQKRSDGMNEAEVKSHVADKLSALGITPERVYPTSSIHALLANQARRCRQQPKPLPPLGQEEWVADFATMVMGSAWDSEEDHEEWDEFSHDFQRLERKINGLWKKSLFPPFLRGVLESAVRESTFISLTSALDTVLHQCAPLHEVFQLQSEALQQGLSSLQNVTSELEGCLAALEDGHKNSQRYVQQQCQLLSERLTNLFAQANRRVEATLDRYLIDGKLPEAIRGRAEAEQLRLANENPGFFLRLFGRLGLFNGAQSFAGSDEARTLPIKDFDPQSPCVTFDQEKDAQIYTRYILAGVRAVISSLEEELHTAAAQQGSEYENAIRKTLQGMVDQIEVNLQESFRRSGFTLDIHLPRVEMTHIEIEEEDAEQTSIQLRRERYIELINEESWLVGPMKRIWGIISGNYALGKRKVTKVRQRYDVHVDTLINQIKQQLNQREFEWGWEIAAFLRDALQPKVDQFFNQVENYMQKLIDEIQHGIQHHQHDAMTKSYQLSQSNHFLQDVKKNQQRSRNTQTLLKSMQNRFRSTLIADKVITDCVEEVTPVNEIENVVYRLGDKPVSSSRSVNAAN
ncbi:MAG: dynamin family protein [Pseudomonadota bacterium]